MNWSQFEVNLAEIASYFFSETMLGMHVLFIYKYVFPWFVFQIISLNQKFEIVSLVGTLNEHAHLHISLSDKDGRTIGGHAIGDLEVFTTAEIVIGELSDLQFTREMDERTGFPELVISPRTENTTSA